MQLEYFAKQPRGFANQPRGFAKLFVDKGWSFSNVDGEKLKEDAQSQRTERVEHDQLEGKYFAEQERFGIAQEGRYQRFADALNAARGAFRSDKVVLAELERFKRSVTKPKKSTTDKDA